MNEAEITDLTARCAAAESRGDTADLANLLTDDFTAVGRAASY